MYMFILAMVTIHSSASVPRIVHARRCTPEEARQFAKDVALSLSTGDYTEVSYEYRGPAGPRIRHDAYAKVVDGEGWFLKIGIVDDGAHIGSCHPTLEQARTQGGTLVPRSQR
jgi:hypothetical protein